MIISIVRLSFSHSVQFAMGNVWEIFVYLFVVQMPSVLSDRKSDAQIEAEISQLRITNFQEGSALDKLKVIVDSLRDGSTNDKRDYAVRFVDKGGIEALSGSLDACDSANENGNSDYYVKSYCGQMMNVLFHGAKHDIFCDKIISSGFLERLLPFLFKLTLFRDANFTIDCFIFGLTALDNIDLGRLAFSLHSVWKNVFGHNLAVLHKRFESETSTLPKLLLAVALLQRNYSRFGIDEAARMSVDARLLRRIRDDLLSTVNYLRNSPDYHYHHYFKTGFVSRYVMYPPSRLLWYFNSLLLSESNRLTLCDKETFEYYFVGVDLFAKKIRSDDSWFCVRSLRGLHALSQSCPNYKDHFQANHIEREFLPLNFTNK